MSAVDVLAVMDGLLSLTRYRVGIKTGAVERASLRGADPYHDNLKLQRAEYLLEQGEQARAAVAELIAADEEYDAAKRDLLEALQALAVAAAQSAAMRVPFGWDSPALVAALVAIARATGDAA